MKPTSPISLLLFLQITTGVRAAPIPLHNDCLHYASCDSPIRDLLSEFSLGSKHTPPATKLANPHFPSHQIDNSPPHPSPQHPALPPPPTHDEKPFNNAPVTPPSSVSPNTALSAEVPLESHYLQSLSQNPTESLAAKPTSALPELREEDLKRYQKEVSADLKKPSGRIHKEHRLAMQAQAEQISAAYNCPHMAIMNIEEGRGAWKASRSREYSDLLVIGIVVLFLCAVVAVEAAEKISDLRQAIFGRSEGAIRLEDDEALFIVKKPFYLQPAPPPRYKIRSLQKGTLQKPAEWSEDDTDVESFKYDSDATEKC